jgi:tmRNA-binding protein
VPSSPLSVDRKTIQRLLDSLQGDRRIVQLSAVLPKGITMVITKDGATITTISSSLSEASAEVSQGLLEIKRKEKKRNETKRKEKRREEKKNVVSCVLRVFVCQSVRPSESS